jgi:ubiquinone/menaquinone biosynthesis C-methylase UbiE
MTRSHQTVVADQYGDRAAAYVASATHASGADLDQVEALAQSMPQARALDLGCGGGHVAYRMAPHVASVTAYDLTPSMLEAVLAEASRRGLGNLGVQQGAAEHLPFADDSFDLVVTRFSAHHWHDVDAGLREMRRVLAPGGRMLVIDTISPGLPLLDTFLQSIELLRDPSHGHNYSLAEWHAALVRARFYPRTSVVRRLRLDFASWVARMNTPPAHVVAIRSLQEAASADARAYFELEADGSFTFDSVAIELS